MLVLKELYRVSQEECARLRESVPYVKVYGYNPKHLYPNLNGYGDNGQRKVRSSCGSTYCTCSADALRVHCACPWEWNAVNIVPALVTVSYLYGVAKMPFVFSHVSIVTCILCVDFAMAMHVLLLKNAKGIFLTEGFRLEVYLLVFTRQCKRLAVFQVLLCSLKGRWYERLTHERTFFRWFREVHVCPLVEWHLASAYHVSRFGELYMRKIYILTMIKGYNIWNQATMLNFLICATG